MQGNFPAGFWPHERISIALLSGPGTFRRLGGEEATDGESFEIYTLAPSSFTGQCCPLHTGYIGEGPGLMGGSEHTAHLGLGLPRCFCNSGYSNLSLSDRNEENLVEVYSQLSISLAFINPLSYGIFKFL